MARFSHFAPTLLAVSLALLPTGCGERGRPALHQSLEEQSAHAAYGRYARILDDSISADLDWLVPDQRRIDCFALDGNSADELDALDPGMTPWHAALVTVLVAPGDDDNGHGGVWLFDPRLERLISVVPSGTEGAFSVVRALATNPFFPASDDRLRVHQHHFAVAIDGTVSHVDGEQLTDGPGDDLMPVFLPEQNLLIVQREVEDHPPQLILIDLTADTEAPLVDPEVVSHARLPVPLDDHRVALVGDLGDGPQIMTVDVVTGDIAPADPNELQVGLPGMLMVTRHDEAGLRPVLLSVPEVITLSQVTALARSRSPGAARNRALVAAALAEARRETLGLWPTLSGGIAYTPTVGLLTNPSGGGSGDFLGEQLVRFLGGIIQPLLNAGRIGALEAAALERARIAIDLAQAAGSQDAVAAAISAVQLRQLEAQHAIALVAESTAADHEQRMRRRADSGEATDAVVLAAAAEAIDATERQELLAKRMTQQRDQLVRQLGLHHATSIQIAEPEFDLLGLRSQSRTDLQRLASIRQPRLRAAARQAEEAFLVAKADRRHAPQLAVGANYGYSVNAEDQSAVDDYLTLSLLGTLPLAAGVESGLVMQRADVMRSAREAALVEERLAVAADVDRQWLAMHEAIAERRVTEARLAAAEEQLRVARLRAEEPVKAPEDPIPLEAIARGERAVATLRLAYHKQFAEAETQALTLLATIGSDQLLDQPDRLTSPLITRIQHERHRLAPPTVAAVRALGPVDTSIRRTVVFALTPEELSQPQAIEELNRCLAAAQTGDRIEIEVHDQASLEHLQSLLALGSPLERVADEIRLPVESADTPMPAQLSPEAGPEDQKASVAKER